MPVRIFEQIPASVHIFGGRIEKKQLFKSHRIKAIKSWKRVEVIWLMVSIFKEY